MKKTYTNRGKIMNKNIIKNHNFGYGENKEEINKLTLNTIEDLNDYLADILENNLDCPYEKTNNQTFKLAQTNLTLKIVED